MFIQAKSHCFSLISFWIDEYNLRRQSYRKTKNCNCVVCIRFTLKIKESSVFISITSSLPSISLEGRGSFIISDDIVFWGIYLLSIHTLNRFISSLAAPNLSLLRYWDSGAFAQFLRFLLVRRIDHDGIVLQYYVCQDRKRFFDALVCLGTRLCIQSRTSAIMLMLCYFANSYTDCFITSRLSVRSDFEPIIITYVFYCLCSFASTIQQFFSYQVKHPLPQSFTTKICRTPG